MAETVRHRSTCRLCGGGQLPKAFSLTPTPPANAFVPAARRDAEQQSYPLDVYFCESCTHLQLLDVVDPAVLYEDYVYASGTSPAFVRHFSDYADWAWPFAGLRAGALAVDIGSNDGTLLSFFSKRGARALGIDPARAIAQDATARGIETLPRFFTPALAAELARERGKASVITANNVFAHIDDLQAVLTGVRTLLAPDGILAFEVSYLADVIEKTLFDTIYHEHLDYHAVRPLVPFLRTAGFELIEAVRVPTHGGSIRIVAQHAGAGRPIGDTLSAALGKEQELELGRLSTYRGFAQRIDEVGAELRKVLRQLKSEGRRIAGFGAPAKATTLLYHFGIGPDVVDYIVDDSPLKQGLFSPGMHIPVVDAGELERRPADYLVVLAWNFASSIIEKNAAFRGRGGRFIVPLPRLAVV